MRSRRPISKQAGVGIVEILVAVLVLSIGLLGLAALQMRTLKNNESAMSRSLAVAETHAIADAMRADRTNALNGLFDIGYDDDAPDGDTFREVVLAAWRSNLINGLGENATGKVDCNGALCEIGIRWDDSRSTEGSDVQVITTWVQL